MATLQRVFLYAVPVVIALATLEALARSFRGRRNYRLARLFRLVERPPGPRIPRLHVAASGLGRSGDRLGLDASAVSPSRNSTWDKWEVGT